MLVSGRIEEEEVYASELPLIQVDLGQNLLNGSSELPLIKSTLVKIS